MRLIFTVCFISLSITYGFCQQVFKKQMTQMGSVFEYVLVAKDSIEAERYFQVVIAEVERIEDLISEWRPHTQVSRVNQNAGISAVKVDNEVFELTRRAITYARMSGGAFDISIAGMDRIWIFDGSMEQVPTQELIRSSVQHVGYQHIILDSITSTIFLKKEGMKIGFGSIGKGYAADKGRELLLSMGVKGGIVNASGDLATWGTQPQNKVWKIGVRNPFKPHKMLRTLPLKNESVTTSGNYEKFAEIDGLRYSHIIDPKTGWPSTGLTSVTVWGPSAEFANFLSTTIMVLGKKKGKALLKNFPNYRSVIIADK